MNFIWILVNQKNQTSSLHWGSKSQMQDRRWVSIMQLLAPWCPSKKIWESSPIWFQLIVRVYHQFLGKKKSVFSKRITIKRIKRENNSLKLLTWKLSMKSAIDFLPLALASSEGVCKIYQNEEKLVDFGISHQIPTEDDWFFIMFTLSNSLTIKQSSLLLLSSTFHHFIVSAILCPER